MTANRGATRASPLDPRAMVRPALCETVARPGPVGIAVIVSARLKSGSIADSCRGAHMSGGLSHCCPLRIVDQVPPASIRAAAHDIACRASEVHVLAVATRAIN
jgi:hypothetical protein